MHKLTPLNQKLLESVLELNDHKNSKTPMARTTSKIAIQPNAAQLDKAQKIISQLDPDIGYTYWLKIGMVLHYLSSGTDEGLQIWDNWSSQGDKYSGVESLVIKYAGFNSDPETCVKMGTLIYIAKKNGVDFAKALPSFQKIDRGAHNG